MVLACFKDGSDEIVGMNVNYVKCADDHFMEMLYTEVKSERIRKYAELMFLLRENFNIFDVYGFDKHLSSIGLTVEKMYRSRGIAEQFLRCRKAICIEFGIKMTSTVFTADSSNRIADKVGFKMDKIIRYPKVILFAHNSLIFISIFNSRYEDLHNTHPSINLPHIKSEAMTIKSMTF